MTDEKFIELCKDEVRKYIGKHPHDTTELIPFSVYVVWYCKTLQNWKALVSTSLNDGMYFELTLNGDRQELYLDAYKKVENHCIAL